MSDTLVREIRESYDGPPMALAVLVVLAEYGSKDGQRRIFPSMETIAERCNLSESQARRYVHMLTNGKANDGVVRVISYENGGANRSRSYAINMEALAQMKPRKVARLADIRQQKRARIAKMLRKKEAANTTSVGSVADGVSTTAVGSHTTTNDGSVNDFQICTSTLPSTHNNTTNVGRQVVISSHEQSKSNAFFAEMNEKRARKKIDDWNGAHIFDAD